jgi:hypothetical protein
MENNDLKLRMEYDYFLAHHDEFLKKFPGRFIVIKNSQVIGDYTTEIEAYRETIKTEEKGTFLIQQCIIDIDEQRQVFHSRVSFV